MLHGHDDKPTTLNYRPYHTENSPSILKQAILQKIHIFMNTKIVCAGHLEGAQRRHRQRLHRGAAPLRQGRQRLHLVRGATPPALHARREAQRRRGTVATTQFVPTAVQCLKLLFILLTGTK